MLHGTRRIRAPRALLLLCSLSRLGVRWWRWFNLMLLASLLRQGNHHQPLFRRGQSVPLIRLVLKHNFILFVVNDHSMTTLIVDTEQGARFIPFSINQMHIYGMS